MNRPQSCPYVSVFYGWKNFQRRLSVCEMNFNVNTKTAACDLSRHQEVGGGSESLRGAIYSNLCASLTRKWASKGFRITGKSLEEVR